MEQRRKCHLAEARYDIMIIDKRNDDEEDEDICDGIQAKQYIKYSKSLGSTHDIYLREGVEGYTLQSAGLLHDLRSMSSGDSALIHLDNSGGDANMGLVIARAVAQCPAHVTIRVESHCYSAGAIIALAGDALEMQPGVFLMFHNFSGGFMGKGQELQHHMENWVDSFWAQVADICCPFLSYKEINDLKQDKDIYVRAPSHKAFNKEQKLLNKKLLENLNKRCKRHFK